MIHANRGSPRSLAQAAFNIQKQRADILMFKFFNCHDEQEGESMGVVVTNEVYVGVKSWWSFLLRGLIGIAFAVILLTWPGSTIKVLAYLVGILALIEGVIATTIALYLGSKKEKIGILLIRGIIGILIGILLLAKTGLTLALVVVLIGIWVIIFGAAEFFAALELPPMAGRGWIAASGLITIILGIFLLLLPLETVYAAIVVFSIFLLLIGILRIVFALYAYRFQKEHRVA